ncbi:hypothetical protein ACERII_06200 [Evansella sp. AB-rgal1]|uniref:hypothetical protein n=1 Tax=Evansella sp. AB-rgal1 TaxID=3242696 RepID=UPI00359E2381
MQALKKYFTIFITSIFIFLFIILISNVYSAKNSGTFYLKDIEGDRSILEDISITGELTDDLHRKLFSIKENEINTRTELYNTPIGRYDNYKFIPGGPLVLGEKEYEVYGENDFDIIYHNIREREKVGLAFVRTEFNQTQNRFSNALEFGLTSIEDKIYFTVPTTADYSGFNGIYELHFVEGGHSFMPTHEKEEASVLTTYPLDQNNMSVLGLESVGEKLALIIKIENDLVIRGFTMNGLELGEAHFDDFFISISQDDSTSYPYDIFVNEDDEIVTLSFQKEYYPIQHQIANIDFSDGPKAINIVNPKIDDGIRDFHNHIEHMLFKNNKLYIILTTREHNNDQSFHYGLPISFFIYVYEPTKLLYKGEIVTDINDDLLMYRNVTSITNRGQLNKNRTLANINIK